MSSDFLFLRRILILYKQSGNMVWQNSIISIFFSLLCYLTTNAQPIDVSFKIYGQEEGLTHRHIFKVQQDREGFIWVATLSGLNKFDGYRFRQYRSTNHKRTLPFDYLTDMHIGQDGLIWLTSDNQVLSFNPKTGQYNQNVSYVKPKGSERVRVSNHFFSISEKEIGYSTFVENRNTLYVCRKNPEESSLCFLELSGSVGHQPVLFHKNHFFVGSATNELLKINQEGESIDTIKLPSSSESEHIVALQTGETDGLWILSNTGNVYYLDADEQGIGAHPLNKKIDSSEIDCFLVEENGDIWIGGRNNLWYFNKGSGKLTDYNKLIQQYTKGITTIKHIYKDRSNVIWFASDYGLIKAVKSNRFFTNYLSGGHENCSNGFCSTRGITEDDSGNIYISYYNSIHVLDPEENNIKPLFNERSFFNFPYDLKYHKGALWTGNGRRINLQSLTIDTLIDQPPIDKGVIMLDDPLIWFGYEGDIYRYDLNRKKLSLYKEPTGLLDAVEEIRYLFQGENDQIVWIGTYRYGLIQLDKEKGVLKVFDQKSGLNSNIVNAIAEDSQGRLWLATGHGLSCLNPKQNEVTTYTIDDGLCNDFINGLLLEGDSCLWVSTDHGISRMSLKNNKFFNFFLDDGLSENEFNRISFYEARNGRMYFGGLNGVNAFFPGPHLKTKEMVLPGRPMLTSFSHFDGSADSLILLEELLPQDTPFLLSHWDRFFTFEFALSDYRGPRENYFSYKLEGFDDNWSMPSTINSARYHNIPAGDYVFRLKASAGFNNWVTEELALPISISQPYYKHTWFIVLITFLLALLFWGVNQYRIYQVKLRERILEAEVKARTHELEVEKKKSDDLLLNILPRETAEELKRYGKAKAKRHEEVTVFFSDFKSFTKIAEALEPERLVAEIDNCFRGFDQIMEKYQLEKIKTIGDAYMCVGGISFDGESSEPASRVIRAALEVQEFLLQLGKDHRLNGHPLFQARIGIHTGPVVAGIVGVKKFAYDIWGDTVNVAARLEEHCEVGKVNISSTTHKLVRGLFLCEHRGKITVKNKGEVDMYYVNDINRLVL